MGIFLICGAEERINVTGPSGGLTNAQKHWNTNGTVAIDTTIFRSGLASFKFAAGAQNRLSRVAMGTPSVGYMRVYFYFSAVTPSVLLPICRFQGPSNPLDLQITTGGVLQVAGGATTQEYSGTLAAGEWYGFEAQADARANPNTLDWRIWRQSTGWVDQTQLSVAQTANTFSFFNVGYQAAATGIDTYADDIVIGCGTTIDEDWSDTTPKGGIVKIYRPNADGAHSFSTSGDFKYENTTNFAQTATDVWSHLDATDMTQTAEFISQNVTSSGVTKYCRVTFPNETVYTDVQGVMPLVAYRSAGTQACEMNTRVSDDGTNWTNIHGNWGATGMDVSETANMYGTPGAVFNPPSGGSWTQAKVNGLEWEFGMSDDVSPVPFVCGLAFEVAWLDIDTRVPRFTPYPQLLAH